MIIIEHDKDDWIIKLKQDDDTEKTLCQWLLTCPGHTMLIGKVTCPLCPVGPEVLDDFHKKYRYEEALDWFERQ